MATIRNAGLVRSALLAVWALLMAGGPSRAAPPLKLALVIGETAYSSLPPLPACAGSARSVAAALRRAGFEVTQRLDTTNGETDAALASLANRLAGAPGSTAAVYFCGYATALETRSFLLPVSATIERPFDVLTQGVVARSAISAVATGTAAGLLVLDVFAQPGNTAPLALDRLTQGNAPPGQGYIAAVETNPGDSATPLATAFAAGLAAPTVELGGLIAELQHRVPAGSGAKFVAAQAPAAGFLVGGPPPAPAHPPKEQPAEAAPPPTPAPPPPAPAPAPPTITATPATPAPAPTATAPTATAPAARAMAPPPIPAMPDENQMTEGDRRRVQAALAVLGYYDGRVDGQFGPETRAAIRRFQHEIGAEMSGRLTGEQAGRLVAGRS